MWRRRCESWLKCAEIAYLERFVFCFSQSRGLLAPSSRRISTMSFIGPGSTELPEVIKPRTSLDFVRGGSLRRRATKDGSPPKARSSQHSLSPLGNNRPFQPHNSSTVMEEEASEA